MSRVPDYLREMGALVEPASEPGAESERRAKMISWIDTGAERARDDSERSRRYWRIGAATFAFAASVAISVVALRSNGSESVATHRSQEKLNPAGHADLVGENGTGADVLEGKLYAQGRELSKGQRVPSSVLLSTRESVRLRVGTQSLRVEPGGRFLVHHAHAAPVGERISFELVEGTVNVKPGPEKAQALCTYVTKEAKVLAFSGRFSLIRLGESEGTSTRVSALGGELTIDAGKGAIVLAGGETWNSRSPVATSSGGKEPLVSKAREREAVARKKAVRTSDLAVQNRMYQEALGAKRRGEVARAKRQLNRLLELYPETPLRPAVLRELTRLSTGQIEK